MCIPRWKGHKESKVLAKLTEHPGYTVLPETASHASPAGSGYSPKFPGFNTCQAVAGYISSGLQVRNIK